MTVCFFVFFFLETAGTTFMIKDQGIRDRISGVRSLPSP